MATISPSGGYPRQQRQFVIPDPAATAVAGTSSQCGADAENDAAIGAVNGYGQTSVWDEGSSSLGRIGAHGVHKSGTITTSHPTPDSIIDEDFVTSRRILYRNPSTGKKGKAKSGSNSMFTSSGGAAVTRGNTNTNRIIQEEYISQRSQSRTQTGTSKGPDAKQNGAASVGNKQKARAGGNTMDDDDENENEKWMFVGPADLDFGQVAEPPDTTVLKEMLTQRAVNKGAVAIGTKSNNNNSGGEGGSTATSNTSAAEVEQRRTPQIVPAAKAADMLNTAACALCGVIFSKKALRFRTTAKHVHDQRQRWITTMRKAEEVAVRQARKKGAVIGGSSGGFSSPLSAANDRHLREDGDGLGGYSNNNNNNSAAAGGSLSHTSSFHGNSSTTVATAPHYASPTANTNNNQHTTLTNASNSNIIVPAQLRGGGAAVNLSADLRSSGVAPGASSENHQPQHHSKLASSHMYSDVNVCVFCAQFCDQYEAGGGGTHIASVNQQMIKDTRHLSTNVEARIAQTKAEAKAEEARHARKLKAFEETGDYRTPSDSDEDDGASGGGGGGAPNLMRSSIAAVADKKNEEPSFPTTAAQATRNALVAVAPITATAMETFVDASDAQTALNAIMHQTVLVSRNPSATSDTAHPSSAPNTASNNNHINTTSSTNQNNNNSVQNSPTPSSKSIGATRVDSSNRVKGRSRQQHHNSPANNSHHGTEAYDDDVFDPATNTNPSYGNDDDFESDSEHEKEGKEEGGAPAKKQHQDASPQQHQSTPSASPVKPLSLSNLNGSPTANSDASVTFINQELNDDRQQESRSSETRKNTNNNDKLLKNRIVADLLSLVKGGGLAKLTARAKRNGVNIGGVGGEGYVGPLGSSASAHQRLEAEYKAGGTFMGAGLREERLTSATRALFDGVRSRSHSAALAHVQSSGYGTAHYDPSAVHSDSPGRFRSDALVHQRKKFDNDPQQYHHQYVYVPVDEDNSGSGGSKRSPSKGSAAYRKHFHHHPNDGSVLSAGGIAVSSSALISSATGPSSSSPNRTVAAIMRERDSQLNHYSQINSSSNTNNNGAESSEYESEEETLARLRSTRNAVNKAASAVHSPKRTVIQYEAAANREPYMEFRHINPFVFVGDKGGWGGASRSNPSSSSNGVSLRLDDDEDDDDDQDDFADDDEANPNRGKNRRALRSSLRGGGLTSPTRSSSSATGSSLPSASSPSNRGPTTTARMLREMRQNHDRYNDVLAERRSQRLEEGAAVDRLTREAAERVAADAKAEREAKAAEAQRRREAAERAKARRKEALLAEEEQKRKSRRVKIVEPNSSRSPSGSRSASVSQPPPPPPPPPPQPEAAVQQPPPPPPQQQASKRGVPVPKQYKKKNTVGIVNTDDGGYLFKF